MRQRLPEAGQLRVLPQQPHLLLRQSPHTLHHQPQLVAVVLAREQGPASGELGKDAAWGRGKVPRNRVGFHQRQTNSIWRSSCTAWLPTAGVSLTYSPNVHRGSIDVPDQDFWWPVPSCDHVGSVVGDSSSLIQGTGEACVWTRRA